jgi:hypothetical protein
MPPAPLRALLGKTCVNFNGQLRCWGNMFHKTPPWRADLYAMASEGTCVWSSGEPVRCMFSDLEARLEPQSPPRYGLDALAGASSAICAIQEKLVNCHDFLLYGGPPNWAEAEKIVFTEQSSTYASCRLLNGRVECSDGTKFAGSFQLIAGGGDNICALSSTGSFCAQPDNGVRWSQQRGTPIQLPKSWTSTRVRDLQLTGNSRCILSECGELVCVGQLAEFLVGNQERFLAFAADIESLCAMTLDHKIRCFGRFVPPPDDLR